MAANTDLAVEPTVQPITANPTPPTRITHILDLPEEIQREICSQCSQCDLICLSLVCKRFHELAAAQLYRNFHIVFPDEDDPSFDSPIDGLAGGLDTFVTSEYNYAKHLRDLSLDTLSAGDKAETAYKPYLFSVSCGKFMNTLLLLTLRKAKALDRFRWNIRVELSRPVYKALHDIKSLKHLHVRMQAGLSLYETPPPLPYHAHQPANSATQWPEIPAPVLPPLDLLPVIASGPGPQITYGPPPVLGPPPPVYKPPAAKSRTAKKQATSKEPPTIGGFKNLESLAVLDIDNLEVITEIKTCVRNSSSALRKLKLSFSDSLAMQARKPCVDVDTNDSDDDDEFQIVPVNPNYDDGSGPAKAFRAQEERKSQESILGRIFDVEPFVLRKPLPSKADKKKGGKDQPAANPGKEYINAIKHVSQRLFHGIHGTRDLTQAQQDMLDTIVQAAQKYVDAEEAITTVNSNTDVKAEGSDNAASTPQAEADQSSAKVEMPPVEKTSESELFQHGGIRSKDGEDETKPEDIDIVAPEEQLVVETQEEAIGEVSQRNDSSADSTAIATPTGTHSTEASTSRFTSAEIKDLAADDVNSEHLVSQAEKRLESLQVSLSDVQHEMNVVEAEIVDANDSEAIRSSDDKEELQRQINEYARGTRGIALHTLSIHLIPVKASVLGRAIDLRTLKKITLINVGNQVPIWALMAKENIIQPLPLRKIFTDHVSLPFLHFVSQLECVQELFMIERSAKYKPESFAPKTKVDLGQIRKLALKKHMATMKRLIIKNEAEGSWDVDEKTIQLICRRGKVLEEMAVVMGIRAVHTFLQYLSGLVNLRALHIISFRNDDTCLSVMRETRRFIVDTVSHYPELKLEWIAMGDEDRAERIIRKTEFPRKSKNKKGKGKEMATGLNANPSIINSPFPVLPAEGLDAESESEDEYDEPAHTWLKLDTIEGIAFYDVWGVRIFKKEIMAARL